MTEPDDAWLDALAGRGAAADSPDAEEGARLRAALLARRTAEPAAVAAMDRTRERELLERARRDGLLPHRPGRWTESPRIVLPAAAAVVLTVMTSLLWRTDAPSPERAGGEPVRLEAADPAALKRRLLDDLSAAGVPATGYERLGVQGVDAELGSPVAAPVRATLHRYGIPVPADGELRVEIVAVEQPR